MLPIGRAETSVGRRFLGSSRREPKLACVIPTRRLGDSRDSRIGSGVIQDGKRRVFAMGQAVPVGTDYTAGEVRRFARRAKDGAQARRLLALAAVLDGASREEAAKIGGMDRQTLRDWVIRYNELGPDGLINIPSPGAPPKLDDTQKAFLRRIVEEGPIPAIHGVVRWRACDLIMRLHDEFGLSVSDDAIYRALKDLGFSHVSARPKAYKQDADAMAAFKKRMARPVASDFVEYAVIGLLQRIRPRAQAPAKMEIRASRSS